MDEEDARIDPDALAFVVQRGAGRRQPRLEAGLIALLGAGVVGRMLEDRAGVLGIQILPGFRRGISLRRQQQQAEEGDRLHRGLVY